MSFFFLFLVNFVVGWAEHDEKWINLVVMIYVLFYFRLISKEIYGFAFLLVYEVE